MEGLGRYHYAAREYARLGDKDAAFADLRQLPLFMAIDSGFRGLDLACRSSLHFDDTQNVPIPANQIQLTPMMRRPVVAGDDGVAPPPQIKISVFLAATAGALCAGISSGESVFAASQSSPRSVAWVRRPANMGR